MMYSGPTTHSIQLQEHQAGWYDTVCLCVCACACACACAGACGCESNCCSLGYMYRLVADL